jgi:hypothetical protein
MWESYTQERERIPTEFLYPVSIEVATQPEVRPATDRIEAESFDDAAQVNLDQVHSGAISSRPGKPGWTGDGGYVGYRRIDFGAGVSAVRLRGRTRNAAPEIELRIDGPEGEAIGAVTGPEHTRPASGGAPEWAEWRGDIAGTAGVHDLYLVALDAGALTLDWFAFE